MKIVPGNIFCFWMMVVASAATLYVIYLSNSGKFRVRIRTITGLQSIDEAVGRATEMGTPVHFSPGLGDIVTTDSAQTLAALEILGYVAKLSAKYDTRLVVTIRMPNIFPMAQEITRQAYVAEGKLDAYRDDTVRFITSDQDGYAGGVVGFMYREKAAANILAGIYMGEALLITEAGSRIGAMQVAITASITQLAFFVATCDYVVIGEELFAAGAYLSQNKVKLGAIAAQDYVKLAVMAALIIGTIGSSAGSDFLKALLTK